MDQGGVRIPIDNIEVSSGKVRLQVRMVGGEFEGVFKEDQTWIKGTWDVSQTYRHCGVDATKS